MFKPCGLLEPDRNMLGPIMLRSLRRPEQHTCERAVAQDIMVEQRSDRMDSGQSEQGVRRKPVPMGDRLSQSPIADLWQTGQVEEIVASDERVNDAKDDHDQQQEIETVVPCFR